MSGDSIELLKECNAGCKMASAMSWITTEMMMTFNGDNHQAAKLMMDGCNMGIQSVCEYENKYESASKEAKDTAHELVKIEKDFSILWKYIY